MQRYTFPGVLPHPALEVVECWLQELVKAADDKKEDSYARYNSAVAEDVPFTYQRQREQTVIYDEHKRDCVQHYKLRRNLFIWDKAWHLPTHYNRPFNSWRFN